MTKTPEQLAEEYLDTHYELNPNFPADVQGDKLPDRLAAGPAFLAGYQAAKEDAHAALEEAESRIDELQSKLSDAGILTTEHLLGADNSSNKPTGWISVKDRLPEINTGFIACIDGADVCTCHRYQDAKDKAPIFYADSKKGLLICSVESVTHWMPLPEAPKDK
jgi:hypothetical protein